MNSPTVVLLGLLAGTLGGSLAHAQPSVVVPSSGRLQEALVLHDSIRRVERATAQAQPSSSIDVWALNALHGVSTLEQMDLYLIRASRERALREARASVSMPGPYLDPNSVTAARVSSTHPVSPPAPDNDAAADTAAGDHEELYRLNQRLAHYEESTLEALQSDHGPDETLVDERLDVAKRRNELARRLGVSPVESAASSGSARRVEALSREVEAWTTLLRRPGELDRERAERARAAALQELDLLSPNSRK